MEDELLSVECRGESSASVGFGVVAAGNGQKRDDVGFR
jgi:hypothetical protein